MSSRVLLILTILISLLAAVGRTFARAPANQPVLLQLSRDLAQRTRDRQTARYQELLRATDPANAALNQSPSIQLMFIRETGVPVYYTTHNLNAARTISTNQVWPGGTTGYNLTGSGTLPSQFAIWDGGAVFATHQEFGGRVTQMDGALVGYSHPTHVAGTMIAAGVDPAAKGMSYEAELGAYDWMMDTSEMAAAAAGGLQLSNHSYGIFTGWDYDGDYYWYGDLAVSTTEDYGFGFYDSEAATWDQIAYNAPYYLICNSAGNDRNDDGPQPGGGHYHWDNGWVWSTDTHAGDGDKGGYDCIAWQANAKNILTVGAVFDIPSGYSQPSDVVQTYFSSWGPTDDGRIKPDIVGNGDDVYSCVDGSSGYASYNGTSMSTPNVSGSINLLLRHYEAVRGGMARSATAKAIVIQTADEAGPANGPDYQNGWGLMNTEEAARLISSDAGIVEATLADGQTDTYNFTTNSVGDLRLTLVWTDPEGTPPPPSLNPTTPMLVNDLDLRIEHIATSTVYRPWVLDGASPASAATQQDNVVDNVERIDVHNAPAGSYRVSVTHKGTLASGSQAYSIVCPEPLATGPSPLLAAYWPFNQAAADTIYDVSGNGHHGLGVGVSLDPGIEGSALSFDGTSRVEFDSPVRNDGPLSVCAWVKVATIPLGTTQYVIANGGETDQSHGFYIGLNATGDWEFGVRDTTGTLVGSTQTPATVDEWAFLCGAWDGLGGTGNIRLYANGTLVDSSGTAPAAAGPANNLKMGASSVFDHQSPYTGQLDDVRIFNYVLKDEEILQVFESPFPDTIARWHFNEAAGDTAYDASGNGHHGARDGALWVSGVCGGTALQYDGVDDSFVVPGGDWLTQTTGTVEAWVWIDPNETEGRLLSNATGGWADGLHLDFGQQLSNNDPILDGIYGGFHSTEGGDHYVEASIDSVSRGRWHFVAIAWDGDANYLMLFVDGDTASVVSPHLGIADTGEPFTIGCWENGVMRGGWFDGMVDDVTFYRKAMPFDSLITHYNATGRYTLTANVFGNGSVVITPVPAPYVCGELVVVEAIADSGWVFSGWSGGLTGTENPDTLEILTDETVTASFMTDSITVTVTTDPEGLEVMVDSVTYISPKVFETTFGSFHRIGAVSPQYGDTIYRFSHWSDGDSIRHFIEVPASDVTYTAFYDIEIPTAIGDLPMPTEVALYQNAPNPFNPTTVIRYDVPAGTSHATLRIYDVTGQLIQTLIDGQVTPGRRSTMWNGKDTRGNPVSSGIYFYRLHAGGRTITKKMVLLK